MAFSHEANVESAIKSFYQSHCAIQPIQCVIQDHHCRVAVELVCKERLLNRSLQRFVNAYAVIPVSLVLVDVCLILACMTNSNRGLIAKHNVSCLSTVCWSF